MHSPYSSTLRSTSPEPISPSPAAAFLFSRLRFRLRSLTRQSLFPRISTAVPCFCEPPQLIEFSLALVVALRHLPLSTIVKASCLDSHTIFRVFFRYISRFTSIGGAQHTLSLSLKDSHISSRSVLLTGPRTSWFLRCSSSSHIICFWAAHTIQQQHPLSWRSVLLLHKEGAPLSTRAS